MTTSGRQRTGIQGEDLVQTRLTEAGFRILARNARVGKLELDLVARRGNLVVFCEVRTRRSDRWVRPVDTLDARKIARVRQAAAGWLKKNPQGAIQIRFDAAAVVLEAPKSRLEYYEGAF